MKNSVAIVIFPPRRAYIRIETLSTINYIMYTREKKQLLFPTQLNSRDMKRLIIFSHFILALILLTTSILFPSCNNEETSQPDTIDIDSITGKCITLEIKGVNNDLVTGWSIGLDNVWNIRFHASDIQGFPLHVGDTIDIRILQYERDIIQFAYLGPYITCQKICICN